MVLPTALPGIQEKNRGFPRRIPWKSRKLQYKLKNESMEKAGISGFFCVSDSFWEKASHSETVREKVDVVQQIHQQVGQADGQKWT